MNTYIFITIFLSIFALLNLYIVKRYINKLDLNDTIKFYLKVFLFINYIGIMGYAYARYNPIVPNWFYFLSAIPIGIVFLFFCTAIIYDISRVLIDRSPISFSRRDFFKKTLDISSLLITTGLSAKAINEARHIEIKNVDIKLKNLQTTYKIIQLSDIHIGGIIDAPFIKSLVKKVNKLKPDIVVITGDLVDINIKDAMSALIELKALKSKFGTYFIVGNHEYFHGIKDVINTIKSLEITVLENESFYIGEYQKGFNLAGVYDVMGYRVEHHEPDLKKALSNIDENSPTILLAHQPKFIEEVQDNVDLVLSGHTHGGQLYPFRLLVKLVQPYISGLYQHSKNTQIYVNKGTGFWGPPMRLGATSEITFITIS